MSQRPYVSPTIDLPDEPGDYTCYFRSSLDGSRQPLRICVPGQEKRFSGRRPLLVVLHGKGADQNTWFEKTTVAETADRRGFYVAAPFARGDTFYRGAAERDVTDAVKALVTTGRIAPNRIYLAGHSMGGWGAWWLAMRNPDMFAAVVAMAGWAPTDLLQNARFTPALIIHDALDDVVPVEHSRIAAEALARMGYDHRYHEPERFAHRSDLISHCMPMIFNWCEEHELGANPMRVELTARTARRARSHWACILSFADPYRNGTLSGRVEDGTRIHIQTTNTDEIAIQTARFLKEGESGCEIIVNGVSLLVPASRGWSVIVRDPETSRWELMDLGLSLPPPRPETNLESPLFEVGTMDEYLTLIAEHLMEATGTQAVMLSPELYRFPAGLSSWSSIADLWVYPDERLGVFTAPKSEVEGVHSGVALGDIRLYCAPGTHPDAGDLLTVLAPWQIATRLRPAPRVVEDSANMLLLRALMKRMRDAR